MKKFGIMNNMPPQINQQAILNWQNWLNRIYPPGPWIPVEGFNTITKLDFDATGGAIFNPNSGYPLKAFINTSTGEVKVFDARRFYSQ